MQVSGEEAQRLLMKWHNEAIPVSLLIFAPGFNASLGGFVSNLEDGSFTITNLAPDESTNGEFTVEMDGIEFVDYREVREASEKAKAFLAGRVASSLQFRTNNIVEGVIYELVRGE